MLDRGYIYLMQKTWGGVVIRAGIVWRDYRDSYEDVHTEFEERYRVFFKAGMAVAYRRVWIHCPGNEYKWESGWGRMKSIPDPQPTNVMGCGMVGVNRRTLKGTGLEYCRLNSFICTMTYDDALPSVCRYLEIHAKHTVLAERMEKE